MPQLSVFDFDFTARKENNSFSQGLLKANKVKINKSTMKVLDLLMQGVVLTVKGAMLDYDISSLPRRILDIHEKLGIKTPRRTVDNKFCEWYFTEKEKALVNEILGK